MGYRFGNAMKSFEAEALINARNSTVWDIITDGGNYTVWDSGITRIDGRLRSGGPIRVRTRIGGNRTFRLRVEQIPGEVMTWTGGLPWGLFKSVCTFTLTSRGGKTLLRVREEFTGPLLGPMWSYRPRYGTVLRRLRQRRQETGRTPRQARSQDPRVAGPAMAQAGRRLRPARQRRRRTLIPDGQFIHIKVGPQLE